MPDPAPAAPRSAAPRSAWGRAVAVWLGIAVAESIHGTLRARFLAPAVGDLVSRQIGVAIGSLMILAIAWATVRWIGATRPRALVGIGLMWGSLMAAFEVTLGRALGLPWARIVADYLPWQGGYMLAGMAVLVAAPWLAVRLRGTLHAQGDPVAPAAAAGIRAPSEPPRPAAEAPRVFGFQPQWKELLICTGPGGRFVLDFPMGVPTVVLPAEARWQEVAPGWALPLWPALSAELHAWCRDNHVRLEIDPHGGVY